MAEISEINRELKIKAKEFIIDNIDEFNGKQAKEIVGATMRELKTGNSEIITEALKEVKKEKKMSVLANTVTVPVDAENVKNEKMVALLENIDAGIVRIIELLEEKEPAVDLSKEKKTKIANYGTAFHVRWQSTQESKKIVEILYKNNNISIARKNRLANAILEDKSGEDIV